MQWTTTGGRWEKSISTLVQVVPRGHEKQISPERKYVMCKRTFFYYSSPKSNLQGRMDVEQETEIDPKDHRLQEKIRLYLRH